VAATLPETLEPHATQLTALDRRALVVLTCLAWLSSALLGGSCDDVSSVLLSVNAAFA